MARVLELFRTRKSELLGLIDFVVAQIGGYTECKCVGGGGNDVPEVDRDGLDEHCKELARMYARQPAGSRLTHAMCNGDEVKENLEYVLDPLRSISPNNSTNCTAPTLNQPLVHSPATTNSSKELNKEGARTGTRGAIAGAVAAALATLIGVALIIKGQRKTSLATRAQTHHTGADDDSADNDAHDRYSEATISAPAPLSLPRALLLTGASDL
jgi:hypothetical protein